MKRGAAALALLLAGCSGRHAHLADSPQTLVMRRQVWAALQAEAPAKGIDPRFVYALVRVESGFNPRAERGSNRGLLQLKPRAWRAVSSAAYDPGVWDWRENLTVGIASLAAMKHALEERQLFSYGRLWAAYHYGWDYLASRDFDMSRIPRPADPLSQALWSGDLGAVRPP